MNSTLFVTYVFIFFQKNFQIRRMIKVWYGKLWLHLFWDEVSIESGRCRAGTEDQNRQRASEMEATPGYTAPTTSKKIFR